MKNISKGNLILSKCILWRQIRLNRSAGGAEQHYKETMLETSPSSRKLPSHKPLTDFYGSLVKIFIGIR